MNAICWNQNYSPTSSNTWAHHKPDTVAQDMTLANQELELEVQVTGSAIEVRTSQFKWEQELEVAANITSSSMSIEKNYMHINLFYLVCSPSALCFWHIESNMVAVLKAVVLWNISSLSHINCCLRDCTGLIWIYMKMCSTGLIFTCLIVDCSSSFWCSAAWTKWKISAARCGH